MASIMAMVHVLSPRAVEYQESEPEVIGNASPPSLVTSEPRVEGRLRQGQASQISEHSSSIGPKA